MYFVVMSQMIEKSMLTVQRGIGYNAQWLKTNQERILKLL